MIVLKTLTPKVKEVSTGLINLKSAEGSLIKKALFCRTGTFDGLYGAITVTKDLLQGIADKYNETKKDAQNENDYAPILTDHVREVDRIKGRALDGLTLEKWFNPESKEDEWGLFGNLRIDDKDAQEKVKSGLYAHLSISFDEETFEFFEISFVAVEAARGSIVLQHSKQNPKGGSNMAKKNSVALALAKQKALKAAVGTNRQERKVALGKLMTKAKSLQEEIISLQAKTKEIALSVKVGQVKSKFNEFIKLGKINPADLKAMDFKSLASMNESSLKIVLAAYETRPVSAEVFQYGQKSDSKIKVDLTPANFREAMKLQKSGKAVKLSAEEKEEDKKDENKLAEGEVVNEEDKKDHPAMSADDMKACLDEMEAHHGKLSECMNKIKEMAEGMKSLSEKEDADENKELAAEDDAKEEKEEKENKLAEGEDDE